MSDTTTMMWIGGACVALTVAASFLPWRIPLRVSVVVALGLRIVVAIIANGHTPTDAAIWFHNAALLVSHGRDPGGSFAATHWNFLPTLPYVWSLLLHLHRSWEFTDKALAIAADCVNTVLVAALATHRKRTRAFQYAVSPLALLVVSWHGQMEPIVLACGLTALVVLRRRRYVLAGALVGLGAAIKTWPIVFALAVLRGTPRNRWLAAAAGIVAVPLAVFLTMPLFLSTDLKREAHIVLGYRSLIGVFGWTAVVNMVRHQHRIGLTGGIISVEQRISTTLLVVSAVAVLWVWRRARTEVYMLAMLLTFIFTTAGFGVQYLMWPLALALACATRRTWLYIWPATVYAALFYLHPFYSHPINGVVQGHYSIAVVIGAMLALPLDQRVHVPADASPAEPEATGDSEPQALEVPATR